jgi:tetratricopeptide (TPR) repeat protein
MRRLTERAARGRIDVDIEKSRKRIPSVVSASCGVLVLVVLSSLAGCQELDARNRIRKGNRLFRDTQFIDAAAEYHRALKDVDDPIIHYNLGLAYSKIFKPGYVAPVLLGPQNDFVCQQIPGAKPVEAGACVKAGDRHFAECGSLKTAPLDKQIADLDARVNAETDETKRKELEVERKDRQDELLRYTCPSSFRCVEGTFCSLTSAEIADIAAQHFQIWIKAQPSDEEIKQQLVVVNKELEAAQKANNQSAISTKGKEAEELQTKDLTRKMMTRLWLDSEQHRKATEYWESLLAEKPNDTEILSVLAGIAVAAGDWRKAIELYHKVADLISDPSSKVAEYQYIGNLAWSKLNSKQLVGPDAIELADRGIAALQKAAELQPKVSRWASLQASIFNFRSTAHGASWAAAIDRATAQDLLKLQRVLAEEAKNAQQGQAGAPGSTGSAAGAAPGATGSAPTSGSEPATGSGAGATPPAPASGSSEPPASPPTPAPTPPAAPTTGGTVEKSGG